MQAEGLERAENVLRGPGHRARDIDVLDAHQPFAAGGARVEPARERGDERTEMQGPGGRGREAALVLPLPWERAGERVIHESNSAATSGSCSRFTNHLRPLPVCSARHATTFSAARRA